MHPPPLSPPLYPSESNYKAPSPPPSKDGPHRRFEFYIHRALIFDYTKIGLRFFTFELDKVFFEIKLDLRSRI
jgi:hypothetical protein